MVEKTARDYQIMAHSIVSQRMSLEPMDLEIQARPADEVEGYAAQVYVNNLLSDIGMGKQVGHKIGCTTPVMQKFLGIPNPCAGGVFEKTVRFQSANIRRSGFIKLGMECEIAVELNRNIFPSDGPFTAENVSSSVSALMAAVEIVDDRYRDYKKMGIPSLIADNFFNSGVILGNLITSWKNLDLKNLTGRTVINGIEVGSGTGKAIMGNPLQGLAWLAQSRASRGLGLKKGDIVLLGSVVETKWLNAGDRAKVIIDDLGEIDLHISRN